jgi:hypothetical protein
MSSERREYFRIQDSVLIKYRVIQNDMQHDVQREVELNRVRIENARAALFGIESDFQEMCEKLKRDQPSTVGVLQILNRKINLLERVISTEVLMPAPTESTQHQSKFISLSGGGLSVCAGNPLALNAKLVIDLILLPSHEPMRIFGRVVNCREIERGEYDIGIEFDEIRDQDRERLIQHVLHRQSEQLRMDKKQHSAASSS